MDHIEPYKTKRENGSSGRKTESYLFVAPPEHMRAHLVARKHGDIARKLEVRACTRQKIRCTVGKGEREQAGQLQIVVCKTQTPTLVSHCVYCHFTPYSTTLFGRSHVFLSVAAGDHDDPSEWTEVSVVKALKGFLRYCIRMSTKRDLGYRTSRVGTNFDARTGQRVRALPLSVPSIRILGSVYIVCRVTPLVKLMV